MRPLRKQEKLSFVLDARYPKTGIRRITEPMAMFTIEVEFLEIHPVAVAVVVDLTLKLVKLKMYGESIIIDLFLRVVKLEVVRFAFIHPTSILVNGFLDDNFLLVCYSFGSYRIIRTFDMFR